MSRLTLLASLTALASSQRVIKLGMDVNWPPLAFEDEDGTLQGFGKDVADGMTELCSAELEFQVVFAAWEDCWKNVTDGSGGSVGAKLLDGTLDACTTYKHTKGVKDTTVEFSSAILQDAWPAGLISLLVDGKPKVDGMDDLAGKTVIDAGHWPLTADTIANVENKCTGTKYSTDLTWNHASGEHGGEHDGIHNEDAAMSALRNGAGDVLYIHAGLAEERQCNGDVRSYDCSLWEGFGTEYAYVQTGMSYAINGTTLTMSKKGSGVAQAVDGCLAEFMQTEAYYDVCVKHGLVDFCYRNEFFPENTAPEPGPYMQETDEHTTNCSDGYCSCDVNVLEADLAPSKTMNMKLSGLLVLSVPGMLV